MPQPVNGELAANADFDEANAAGSTDGWVEKKRVVNVPDDVQGIRLILALWNVANGQLQIDYFHAKALSKEEVAAARAERERIAAIERAKFRPQEEFGEPVSDARFAKLAKGININNWFGQPYNAGMNGKKGAFTKE